MQIYAKLILIYTSFFFFFSCISIEEVEFQDYLSICTIGETCNLKGQIWVSLGQNGNTGVLQSGDQCIALVVPDYIAYNSNELNFKAVSITGEVHIQPYFSGTGIISYELKDRSVLTGACETGKIIYVTELKKIKEKVEVFES